MTGEDAGHSAVKTFRNNNSLYGLKLTLYFLTYMWYNSVRLKKYTENNHE